MEEKKTKIVPGYITVTNTYEFWYEFPADMSDKEAKELANYYAGNEYLDYYKPISTEIN